MTFPGGAEWVIILFIVLLLFGAKKLPGLASSVGTSMKEFRRASREALEDDESETDAEGTAGPSARSTEDGPGTREPGTSRPEAEG